LIHTQMDEELEKDIGVSEAPEVKLFGKWTTSDVQINDISLTVSSSCNSKLECARVIF